MCSRGRFETCPYGLHLFKDILASAAQRAAPVIRNIFKSGSWGYSMVWIAYSRVILILADVTDVLLHIDFSLGEFQEAQLIA